MFNIHDVDAHAQKCPRLNSSGVEVKEVLAFIVVPIGAPGAAVVVLALAGRPSARYDLLGTVELVALVAFSFVLSATDDRVSVSTLAVELEYEYSDLLSLWDKSSWLFTFATLALHGSLQPVSALALALFSVAPELTE